MTRGPTIRHGFTLVEVMVVVVVASLIGLGVAGTVSVALDTRQRVEARRLEVRSELAWRALVIDVLRNARPPAASGDSALLLSDGTGPDGVPADRLAVLTSGSLPPLHSGTDWVVSLEPFGRGVRLQAAPVGVRSVPVQVRAPDGITGVEIEAVGADGRWQTEWADPRDLPAAIRLTFRSPDGVVGVPITVRLPKLVPVQ